MLSRCSAYAQGTQPVDTKWTWDPFRWMLRVESAPTTVISQTGVFPLGPDEEGCSRVAVPCGTLIYSPDLCWEGP